MPNRQPLYVGWGDETTMLPDRTYIDHDKSRCEQHGRAQIVFVANNRTRKPKRWQPRILLPNQHGIMCEIGRVTYQMGRYFIRMYPYRLKCSVGKIDITHVETEADAIAILRALLPVMFP